MYKILFISIILNVATLIIIIIDLLT